MHVFSKSHFEDAWKEVQKFRFENGQLTISNETFSGFLKLKKEENSWLICEKKGGEVQLFGDYLVRHPVCVYGPETSDLNSLFKTKHDPLPASSFSQTVRYDDDIEDSFIEDELKGQRIEERDELVLSCSSSNESEGQESNLSEYEDDVSEISSIGEISDVSVHE